jgi:hypothetical protein
MAKEEGLRSNKAMETDGRFAPRLIARAFGRATSGVWIDRSETVMLYSMSQKNIGVSAIRDHIGRIGRQRYARAEKTTVARATFAAMAMLCAHCQREVAPQPSAGQPADTASSSSVTVSSLPAAVGSLPSGPPRSASPERHGPAPTLAPGKQIAWQIEQYGQPVSATLHTVELARAPFSLVIHLRAGIRDLFANASFESRTFDAARLGWRFGALAGFQGGNGSDLDERPPAENNRLRDIFIHNDSSSRWTVCPPDSTRCDGFDGPCESTMEGAVCRRSIERVHVLLRDELLSREQNAEVFAMRRIDITSTKEKGLYLVFMVPGHWSEDERAGKLPYQSPEFAREWAMSLWKSQP